MSRHWPRNPSVWRRVTAETVFFLHFWPVSTRSAQKRLSLFSSANPPHWGHHHTPKQRKIAPFSMILNFSEPQRKIENRVFDFLKPLALDPPPWKWPSGPPQTAISQAPGANRAHCVRIHCAIEFGGQAFRPKQPLRPGKSIFLPLWPVLRPGRPQSSSVSLSPAPKTGKSRIADAGSPTVENGCRTKVAQTCCGSNEPPLAPQLCPNPTER